jgi:hypothetical protein
MRRAGGLLVKPHATPVLAHPRADDASSHVSHILLVEIEAVPVNRALHGVVDAAVQVVDAAAWA